MIHIEEAGDDKYVCMVQRLRSTNKNRFWLPKTHDDNGSIFGGCLCGHPFTVDCPVIT